MRALSDRLAGGYLSHPSMPADDAALLASISRGDERAFLSLYERFSGPVYSLLMKMLQNQQDAEDVLQAVFLQVWKKADYYRADRCSVFTWLVLVARSKAIDRMRQRQRQHRTMEEASLEGALHDGRHDTTTGEAMQHESEAAVRGALERIPAEQREAIEMAFFKGMSQTEISECLSEPLGTVKARIRRGMLRLRGYLGCRL